MATVSKTLSAFLLPYASFFRQKGWAVDAIAWGAHSDEAVCDAFDRVFDTPWSRNPLEAHRVLASMLRVRRIIGSGGYDIVHVHTPVASFVTRIAVGLLPPSKRPVVVYTAHGFHFHDGGSAIKNAVYRGLEWLAGRVTDYLVVINAYDYDEALRLELTSPERIRLMPGIGVDTGVYAAEGVSAGAVESVRAEMGLREADRFVLMVAEFIPRKRHVDALKALSLLGRQDLHLAFAGDGLIEEDMRAAARAIGVENRVHFLGRRSDIPALMTAASAVLLPSLQEGLPRSILEAMSIGRPVIASDIRGNRDLLSDGAGLLVPVRDAAALADAIRAVMDDAGLAASLAAVARERVRAHDIGHLLRLHDALYREALGGTEALPPPMRAGAAPATGSPVASPGA